MIIFTYGVEKPAAAVATATEVSEYTQYLAFHQTALIHRVYKGTPCGGCVVRTESFPFLNNALGDVTE